MLQIEWNYGNRRRKFWKLFTLPSRFRDEKFVVKTWKKLVHVFHLWNNWLTLECEMRVLLLFLFLNWTELEMFQIEDTILKHQILREIQNFFPPPSWSIFKTTCLIFIPHTSDSHSKQSILITSSLYCVHYLMVCHLVHLLWLNQQFLWTLIEKRNCFLVSLLLLGMSSESCSIFSHFFYWIVNLNIFFKWISLVVILIW